MQLAPLHEAEVFAESAGEYEGVNADSFAAKQYADGKFLAAVADGMGGENAKKRDMVAPASRKAVEILSEASHRNITLEEMFNKTAALYRQSAIQAGTTLTAALIDGNRLQVAQIGDSLAYLFRDGKTLKLADQQIAAMYVSQAFGKHPSLVTLDELLAMYDKTTDFPNYIVQQIVVVIGIGLYYMACVNKDIRAVREAVAFFQKFEGADFVLPLEYPVEQKLMSQIRKLWDAISPESPIATHTLYELDSPESVRELEKLFAQITYTYWNDPWVCNHDYWTRMVSTLSHIEKEKGSSVTRVSGFSENVALENDSTIKLYPGDTIAVATDGIIRHIAAKHIVDGPLKNYPGANWDYWVKRPDRVMTKFFELYQQDPQAAIRDALHPDERRDDATLVIVKYLG